MDIVFSSFGLTQGQRYGSDASLFGRMPPVIRYARGKFAPDYCSLLLSDRVVLDAGTWSKLNGGRYALAYKQVAEDIRVLYKEGFVRIEDFESILQEKSGLLREMIEQDLRCPQLWSATLRESLELWENFLRESMPIYLEYRCRREHIMNTRPTSTATEDLLTRYSDIMCTLHSVVSPIPDATYDNVLYKYLSYVNANLVLAAHFECPLYDWEDFLPFYRSKMLQVGYADPRLEPEKIQMRRLFELALPSLADWGIRDLIRVLKDPRIEKLRELISAAGLGEIELDSEFIRRTLAEVVGRQSEFARKMKKVALWCAPVGFIPWAGASLQFAVQEAIERREKRKMQSGLEWFFFIAEGS